MFFSVIIPIYNSEKTLVRCLDSVRNQKFQDFEVIMINDGSQDSSGDICELYQSLDSRFRYIYQNNSGVSTARNRGMKEAAGDFITFLDSDDVYFNTYLSSFCELIQKYPDYGHYWCAFMGYGEDDKPNGDIYAVQCEEKITFSDRSNIMSLHAMTLDGSPWNKVYRKKLLNDILMRPHLSLGEDMIFNFEYLDKNSNTKIVINNVPQYGYYCVSENSLDHKYRPDLEEIYGELIDVMLLFLNKWEVSAEQWKQFYNMEFFMYEKVLQNIFRVENNESQREKYAKSNRILHSNKFKDALKRSDGGIHIVYRLAYQIGHYEIVVCLNRMVQMIKRHQVKG